MENQNWDKIYSTFWWIITLDPNHPENQPNVKEMTGYSKKAGHDEAKDKPEMLMKRIIMLFNNGYFEKSKYIRIYMKQGELLNKSTARPLLLLKRNDYKISEESKQDKEFYMNFFVAKGIIDFLGRFYDCIHKGEKVDFLLPKSKTSFTKDDYLNIDKYNFKSQTQLHAHCVRLIRNNHPFDAVMNFARKYEEHKPFS